MCVCLCVCAPVSPTLSESESHQLDESVPPLSSPSATFCSPTSRAFLGGNIIVPVECPHRDSRGHRHSGRQQHLPLGPCREYGRETQDEALLSTPRGWARIHMTLCLSLEMGTEKKPTTTRMRCPRRTWSNPARRTVDTSYLKRRQEETTACWAFILRGRGSALRPTSSAGRSPGRAATGTEQTFDLCLLPTGFI